MKIFFAKRLWVTLISLLMVSSVITSACYDEPTSPGLATSSFTVEPILPTCERKISDAEPIEDSLSWPSEECYFYFYATVGEIVTITMRSIDEDFDPYLKLYDPYDSLLTENDDHSYSLDSRISGQTLPLDGWYTIVAKSYNSESFGRFELTLTKTESGNGPQSPECGRTIDYGESVLDTIVWPGEECYFRFLATANDRITILMRSIDEDLDSYLKLYDPYDSLLTENDDHSYSLDSRISGQTLPLDGWYIIVAKSYNNESFGRFELTLTKTELIED